MIPDDPREMIQVKHEEDLAQLLKLFDEWQRSEIGRELLVLSGDVHLGGFTDIWLNVKKCSDQVTISVRYNCT